MNNIKRIEIRDLANNFLIDLPDILRIVPNREKFYWGLLPLYDPMGVYGDAQNISIAIQNQISEKKFALINWEDLEVLAQGVRQFIDFTLIGCKDPKALKSYKTRDEIVRNCDIVIIMFDTCWWEISCLDKKLIKKFINEFKQVKIIGWGKGTNFTT
ncbi:MAG: hypothetical protein S4CHLAM7_12370 [Chlamydiae bacterium]|nr:hypothetical protein [Chlamydiota bacterium]